MPSNSSLLGYFIFMKQISKQEFIERYNAQIELMKFFSLSVKYELNNTIEVLQLIQSFCPDTMFNDAHWYNQPITAQEAYESYIIHQQSKSC